MTIDIVQENFCIEQILECGQCFRFERLAHKDYMIIAKNKIVRVTQESNVIRFFCHEKDYKEFWYHYFHLDCNYGEIKKILAKKDPMLKKAIEEKHGVRIIRQDPFEMLISFIISQNKQIPHIKKIIETLAMTYGNRLEQVDNKQYFAFPTVEQLQNVSEEEFRSLKVGFRAPYLVDAIQKVVSNELDLEAIYLLSYEEARKELMKVKGVGPKVADCVLLFGYGKYDVFPTDVWVKRIMEYFYFKKETPIKEIEAFAKEKFSDLAGFAQQYLFYYARDNKLGK